MSKVKRQLFISNLIKSIKDFDYYKEVNTEKLSKSFIYFVMLILIYSIVTTIGIVYNLNESINEIVKFMSSEIQSLNYSNGTLSIDNDEYKSVLSDYIIIDTSKEKNDEYENKANIVIGKYYASIKLENQIFKFKYNDFFYENINKDDIIQTLSNNKLKYYVIFSIITLILTFIILSISTLTDIVIISLIGIIISGIIGNRNLKFSNMFKITTHAISLSIILSMIYYTINTFIGFYIKYFSIMYTSIATIYVITAILLITMDSNKKNENNI